MVTKRCALPASRSLAPCLPMPANSARSPQTWIERIRTGQLGKPRLYAKSNRVVCLKGLQPLLSKKHPWRSVKALLTPNWCSAGGGTGPADIVRHFQNETRCSTWTLLTALSIQHLPLQCSSRSPCPTHPPSSSPLHKVTATFLQCLCGQGPVVLGPAAAAISTLPSPVVGPRRMRAAGCGRAGTGTEKQL